MIVADDGLQHYRLARNVEIVVVDGARGLGNGWRLPAGPLREPASRLEESDAIVVLETPGGHARWTAADAWRMTLGGDIFRRVNDPARRSRPPRSRVSACTRWRGSAIRSGSSPSSARCGIAATAHAFPDHHRFTPQDLALPGARAVLMTEKDAVKCAAFADERCWYLPVHAHIDTALVARVEEALRGSEAA